MKSSRTHVEIYVIGGIGVSSYKEMFLIAATIIGLQRTAPGDLMRSLVEHYHKLKSFSAKVIHHGDFVGSVKDATDTVQWLAPKRFELTSDKDSVPKFMSDGKRLVTIVPQLPPLGEELMLDSTRIAPWEYRGGFILSLLMRSAFADQLLKPSRNIKLSYSYGKTLKWHGRPVSEIQGALSSGKTTVSISYYLTPDYHALIGTEIVTGPESIWTEYTEVAENPAVAATLGSVKQ